jgi:glycosyltransferase involved in cell wall biosynthesis
MQPEVSVIVPVYNAEQEIGPCVESILASRFAPEKREVICVDNNSTDGTLAVLRSFGAAIQVLSEKTRGAGAARNAGLKRASGEFIAFTDADCTVHPDWLDNILIPLRDRTACAVGGRIRARPGAGAIERFGELIHDHQKAIEVYQPPYIISMNMACRRDLLLAVGGFDERWLRMQDGDLSWRLLDAGRKFAYRDDAVIFHHNRDTLPKLLREGFLHGFWGASFSRAWNRFALGYLQEAKRQDPAARVLWPYEAPREEPPSPPPEALSPMQVDVLWRVFKFGKTAGRIKGRWFPPVQAE